MTSLTGPDLLASWLWRSITDPGVPGSIPGRGTRWEYFFTGLFLLLLHLVPGARMTTIRAQGRCNGNRVTKEPGNSRKHLIQMFHCRIEECSGAAKRSTNNQYVCKYIGRINDQSNWSGPFSLVVMMLDYRSRGTWFDPRSGIFSLQVYFSSYYTALGFQGLPNSLKWWTRMTFWSFYGMVKFVSL